MYDKTALNVEIRVHIKGSDNVNISALHIFDDLCLIHRTSSVLSKTSDFRWHKTFKDSIHSKNGSIKIDDVLKKQLYQTFTRNLHTINII